MTRNPWPPALAALGLLGAPREPKALIPVLTNNSPFIRRFQEQTPVAAGGISDRHKSPRVSLTPAKAFVARCQFLLKTALFAFGRANLC